MARRSWMKTFMDEQADVPEVGLFPLCRADEDSLSRVRHAPAGRKLASLVCWARGHSSFGGGGRRPRGQFAHFTGTGPAWICCGTGRLKVAGRICPARRAAACARSCPATREFPTATPVSWSSTCSTVTSRRRRRRGRGSCCCRFVDAGATLSRLAALGRGWPAPACHPIGTTRPGNPLATVRPGRAACLAHPASITRSV